MMKHLFSLPPRWRKVLRDLWLNRTRMILIVLTITVGVFAIGAISATQIVLEDELPRRYAAIDPAHVVFTTSLFEQETVASIANLPGVAAVEGRRNLPVRLLQDAAQDRWRDLFLFAMPDFDDQQVYKIAHVSGQWPPAKGTVAMERGSLAYLGLQEGQPITLKTGDGRQRTVRISAIGHDLYHMPPVLEGTVYAYITEETLDWLGQERGFNELYVRLDGDITDRAYMRQMTAEIEDHLEGAELIVYPTYQPQAGSYPLGYIADTIILLLTLLGALILLLSAFLVINTITALLAQQTRQIGVLKAVGGRARQVAGIYLGMILVLSLLGTLLGLPLSVAGAQALVAFVADMMNFDVRMANFPWQALARSLAVGLLTPLFVALVPIAAGARTPPAQALSEYGSSQVWRGMLHVDRLLRRLPGLTRPALLALRNPFRRRSRLLFSLVMLALAGGSFITVLNLHASLQTTVDEMISFWQYDFWVDLNRPYRIERLQQEAAKVAGVAGVEGWGNELTRRVRPDGSESNNIFLFGVPPDSTYLSPTILAGRWLESADTRAVVVGAGLLNAEPDLALGGDIVLKINGDEEVFHIAGVMQAMGNQTVGYMVYIPYDSYASLAHKPHRADMAVVLASPDASAMQKAAVAAALEDRFDQAGIGVSSVLQMTDERAEIDAAFGIIVALLMVMVVLLAFVGGLGLMGTMSLNVIERAREIGVLRAFGGSNASVFRIVIAEGVAVGAMSWVLSLVLALPLTALFCNLIGYAFLDTALAYTYALPGALLWLALVTLLAVIASSLPALNAVRLTVREVLSYE
ncbi:MAG: ABC transporter permease [Chloroflexota bacterium]